GWVYSFAGIVGRWDVIGRHCAAFFYWVEYMSFELVTIEDARAHLRLDYESDSDGDTHGPDDPWLQTAIPAISEAVRGWLKDDWRLYLPARDSTGAVVLDSNDDPVPAEDSNGDPIVHPTVRLAVLVELASVFR